MNCQVGDIEWDSPLEPDSDQCLIDGIRRLVEIRSENVTMSKPAWSVNENPCEDMQQESNAANHSTAVASQQHTVPATKPCLSRQASYAIAISASLKTNMRPSFEGNGATATLGGESCTVDSTRNTLQVVLSPQLHPQGRPASAATAHDFVSAPPSTTTQIAQQTHASLVPTPTIGNTTTSIASHVAVRSGPAASAPPVTRVARGQLAYDTQRIDARTARRLLGNRASAARSQQRRADRLRKVEAALARSFAENKALREQLEAALRMIKQLGHSAPPAALPPPEPLPVLELPSSRSESC